MTNDLEQLAVEYSSVQPVAAAFKTFTDRETHTGAEDAYSKELTTSLMDLVGIASSTVPTDTTNHLFTQLLQLVQSVDACLVDYHREYPGAQLNELYPWRLQRFTQGKEHLLTVIRQLKDEFKEYVPLKRTTKSAPSTVKQAKPAPKPFDPCSESSAGTTIGHTLYKQQLIGSPKVGRHAVWRVESVTRTKSTNYVAKFYREVEDFKREYTTLKALNKDGCRNVIQVSSVVHDAEGAVWSPFNALILYYGEITLSEYWTNMRSRMDLTRAFAIVHDIVAGLEHCHKQHIVHCNVRPENVMLMRSSGAQEHWVLVDFDTSRRYGC
jgi:hypothetical protein